MGARRYLRIYGNSFPRQSELTFQHADGAFLRPFHVTHPSLENCSYHPLCRIWVYTTPYPSLYPAVREMHDSVPDVLTLGTSVSNRNRKKPALAYSRSSITENDGQNEHLMLAVEQGLSVLGKNVSEILFDNLEKRYSLRRNDIIDKPDRFVQALEDMFGSGAGMVERLVVKYVCGVTGIDPSTPNPLTFLHCVEIVKNQLRARRKQKTPSI